MFGNLFRKKSRKPSKDDETGRLENVVDAKASPVAPVAREQETNEKDDSLRNDWDAMEQHIATKEIQVQVSVTNISKEESDSDIKPIILATKESVKASLLCFEGLTGL